MSRIRRTSRSRGSRAPAARVVVVTEGELTEPEYLKVLNQVYGSQLLRLVPIGIGGDPRAVVERAIAERNKVRGDPLANSDTFWAMFDRDSHPRFDEAKDLARSNKISLAVSNPCFELWGILHYRDQDAPLDRNDCQRDLEKLCPGYGTGGDKVFDNKRVIEEGYECAVERAKLLHRRREEEGTPGGNPSTSVYRLTEHIRKFKIPS